MKKTMILGLCIALIMSIIMIGGEVKAAAVAPHVTPLPEVTPHASASVDYTTLKKGDTVTLTVKFPRDLVDDAKYTEQYLIEFDNEKFSYKKDSIKLTGYGYTEGREKVDCLVLTDRNGVIVPENYSGNQIYVFVGAIFEKEQIFSGFSVQFEVKEDLTEATSFKVSDLNENGDEVEDHLEIPVNSVEPEEEPQPEPESSPEDTPTVEPGNENSGELDNSPGTGVADYVGIVGAIAMISMLGVGLLRRKK